MKLLTALLTAGLSAGFFVPTFGHGPDFDWIQKNPDKEIASCCGKDDCHYVAAGRVEATGAGWFLHDTGETFPFDDSRIKQSRDGRFVRCHETYDKDKTRCLFVPNSGS